jgi:hypothetical protein
MNLASILRELAVEAYEEGRITDYDNLTSAADEIEQLRKWNRMLRIELDSLQIRHSEELQRHPKQRAIWKWPWL